jgi:hypothetical protein
MKKKENLTEKWARDSHFTKGKTQIANDFIK